VCFLLKRLADAEAAGDRIYAVIRGIGSSSDGKGKGITAPNNRPAAGVQRAWDTAGLRPGPRLMVWHIDQGRRRGRVNSLIGC
jgi:acyl transferase domain-containing protein